MVPRFHLAGIVLVLSLVACDSPSSDLVARADSLAAVIDSQADSLARDTAVVFDLSTEGAFLEAHYQHDSLRRLRGSFLGESGRATRTFYFNPALFLVVTKDEEYDAPLSGRVRDSSSDRIYVAEGGVVRWVRRPVPRGSLDSAAARRAADSLDVAARELLGRLPQRQVVP